MTTGINVLISLPVYMRKKPQHFTPIIIFKREIMMKRSKMGRFPPGALSIPSLERSVSPPLSSSSSPTRLSQMARWHLGARCSIVCWGCGAQQRANLAHKETLRQAVGNP